MIELGVSWFPGIEGHDDIVHAVDFVEIPIERYRDLREDPHHRIVLHNERLHWSLASPAAIDSRWADTVQHFCRKTATPWFSIHLGFASEEVRFENHMLPLSEPLDCETLLDRFIAKVRQASRSTPVPLIVENLDYCPEGAYEHICHPEFIREVVEETGAGLLLDIGHLQVSASWLEFSVPEALNTLPLDQIVEIHMSSPRLLEDGGQRLDDAHETLLPRDLAILEEVLRHVEPKAITLEYRRNPGLIVVELDQIRKIVNG